MSKRVYLDWNATTPLRPEARAAMIAAMDVVGNPSSVHGEGRAAKAIVERARAQVGTLVGVRPADVVFTGGATEAAHLILNATPWAGIAASDTEHDCILANIPAEERSILSSDNLGYAELGTPYHDLCAVSAANSETGVCNDLGRFVGVVGGDIICDITQATGKIEIPPEVVGPLPGYGVRYLILSAHKFGGPKGVGAAVLRGGSDLHVIQGGGQEMGRRAGTENVVGIAGFGAAAEAAQRDLDAGVWGEVEKLRNILEKAIAAATDQTIFVGKDANRLPNTSCFATPGWKGETQVMAMDLAGFAISAGSACSSGKVKESRVLRAMGYDEITARSAVRVSLGPTTTLEEIERFADAWIAAHRKFRARAA